MLLIDYGAILEARKVTGMSTKTRGGPVYPEANLVPDADDEWISSEELAQIELFGALKRKIKVEEAPGSLLLRRFRAGEVICRQGEPGNSAFYLVPAADMVRLRRFQLSDASRPVTDERRRLWEEDVTRLESVLETGQRAVVARAYLFFTEPERRRSWWSRLWGGASASPALPEKIAVDAPVDVTTAQRSADLCEGDIFGEMSCLMFTPRSATVVAQRECFAIEFLRSVLDNLQREESFRQRMDAAYRQRVLDGHLRRLQFLNDVTDEELSCLRPHIELQVREPGDVIFEEGDPSDAAYIVRSGFVQIVQNLDVTIKPRHMPRLAGLCQRLCEAKREKPATTPGAGEGAQALLAKLRAGKPAGAAGPTPERSPVPTTAAGAENLAGAPPSAPPQSAGQGTAGAAQVSARTPAASPQPASHVPKEGAPQSAELPPVEGKEPLLVEQPALTGLSPLAWLWQWLAPRVQEAVERVAQNPQPDPEDCLLFTQALNLVSRHRKWLSGPALKPIWQQPEVGRLVATFPRGTDGIGKDWSDIQVRMAGRTILHALAPEFIPARARTAPPKIIRYMGRGECFGELGVVLQRPRSASAIAYDHPATENRRAASRVELVRIPGPAFREFLERVPRLAERVQQQIAHYQRLDETRAAVSPLQSFGLAGTAEFRDLGLAQGQKLLVIDLDRCTRCGDCVRACIRTHDDGLTRLYLDGPRFGRFLIPAACRQCRDPLCMIGCPVGSIQRGDNGQIVIRDWCIGCALCARQCPYDSIQMHDLGIVPESAAGWRIAPESAVEEQNWWEPHFSTSSWASIDAPFYWSPDLAATLAKSSRSARNWLTTDRLIEGICLRYDFRLQVGVKNKLGFAVECTTKVGQVKVWFNGQTSQLEKGCGRVDLNQVKTGRNTLCVLLSPADKASPLPYDSPFLRVWMGALPEVTEMTRQFVADLQNASFKLQAARAVVCDLCSDLPGQQPACVRECPHTAAMRIDALAEFPALD